MIPAVQYFTVCTAQHSTSAHLTSFCRCPQSNFAVQQTHALAAGPQHPNPVLVNSCETRAPAQRGPALSRIEPSEASRDRFEMSGLAASGAQGSGGSAAARAGGGALPKLHTVTLDGGLLDAAASARPVGGPSSRAGPRGSPRRGAGQARSTWGSASQRHSPATAASGSRGGGERPRQTPGTVMLDKGEGEDCWAHLPALTCKCGLAAWPPCPECGIATSS